MNASTRFGLALALLLGTGGAFLACGGDDKGSDDDDGDTTDDDGNPAAATGTLRILFNPMYSAYVPDHTFQLPVKVDGVPNVTFKASDESKVDVVNNADGAMLTMKAPGTVTITAEADGQTGSATLTITEGTEEQWKAGNDRYNNGISALPGDGGLTGGGGGPGAIPMLNFNGACTTCHGEAATALDVQHTPMQTGGYSDSELITLFTMGDKPQGFAQRTLIPEFLWGMGHRWMVTEEEKQGLVIYLRSLAPKSQGDFDFPVRITDAGLVDRDGNPIRFDGGGTRRDSGGTLTTTTDAGVGGGDEDSGATTTGGDS